MNWAEIFIDASTASIGPVAAAFALAGLGLNLQFGYAGLLNFGHIGFMLIGAYGTAISVEAGSNLWVGIIVGLLAAAAFGIVLGAPTLRLRSDYLAIVTISASEILRLVVRSGWADPVTKSVFGIQGFAGDFFDLNPLTSADQYGFGDFAFTGRQLWVMIVGWGVVVLSALLLGRIVASPWGRVLRAIREDEDAARALGKNVYLYKMQSLLVGGSLGALGGILISIEQQNVISDSFLPRVGFFLYVIVILGGAGTVWGPAIGAIMFQFLFFFFDGFMREAEQAGWFGNLLDATGAQQVKLVMVGIGLMALMTLRPQGIFGSREELLIDER